MIGGDCVIPEMYKTSMPIAFKEHRCCECRAPILKGEKHVKCVGKWEGDFGTHRQHLACCEACEWFRKHGDGECIPFGGLKDEWREMAWQYDRTKDRDKLGWKEIRHLMAVILRRERAAKRVV